MWQPARSRLIRYGLPFTAIVVCLLLQMALQVFVPKTTDFPYAFFYLIAVFAVAWFGGYLPGLIACLLTMVGLPLLAGGGFRLSTLDPARIGILMAVSLGISWVSRQQASARNVMSGKNDALEQRVQQRTRELVQAVAELESEVHQRREAEKKLQTQLGRMNLLDQITRLIAERQDLRSVFQIVVRTIEESLPVDFACVCQFDPAANEVSVSCVGIRSQDVAMQIGLPELRHVQVIEQGLGRCLRGHLVYEPDIAAVDFPFTNILLRAGLRSIVGAPLVSESNVFGMLVVARLATESFSSGECEFLRQLSEHVALAGRQAQDHTALEQAYEELRRSQEAILEQERLRALGQMASGIAHDINNALSPVALYTEALLETEPGLSARARQYLETTYRAIDDVSHTVARMREFYRRPEAHMPLASLEVNRMVIQVLELTRARWKDMAQQQGIQIQMRRELTPGASEITGIESEVREALTNLVLNAVDAMPAGGTLTVRTGAVSDGVHTPPNRVYLEVQDTGTGMSEETRRRCLEPFFTTKGERGTGLGLAMVYGVAQRHGAEVEIESELGKGTTIRLNFPASVPGVAEGQAVPAERKVVLSRLPILIVDDDPLVIKSLRDILESDGHIVTVANGGREGVEAVRTSKQRNERFAVVITDLGMPHVDGRKVATAVKVAWKDTPVILLTGWGQRLVDEEGIPPNVDRVLNKPPRVRQLRTALSELMTTPTQA